MSPVAATIERLQSRPATLNSTRHVEIITGSTGVSKPATLQSRKNPPPRPTRVHSRVTRARRGRTGKTQPRSLPSVIGSAAPAHGFTHAVSPTACRFPPPTPDRSVIVSNSTLRENNLAFTESAPVAQLDRARDFGSRGCRFKSCRVRHFILKGKLERQCGHEIWRKTMQSCEIKSMAHPLCAVRVNRAFNGMSPVGASRLFAPVTRATPS